MGEVEAAAELAQGGLMGRAIEPGGSGKGPERVPQEGECLNCCTRLEGEYCHHCGQAAHVHRTLGGIIHDIMHGVLHLDGKFWRTIPMLAFKPGELTRRYISGQRARFISPIALYLFTVVAMFAFVVSVGEMEKGDVRIGTGQEAAATIEAQQERIAEYRKDLEELSQQDFPGSGAVRKGLERELGRAEQQLEAMQAGETLDGLPEDIADTRQEISDELKADLAKEGIVAPVNAGDWEVNLGPFTQTAEKIAQGFAAANDNPALFFTRVSMKAYKLSWLLIPISLPFMWLLFPFSRRFRMYDHAIFVTYSIAFMMLLATLLSIAASLGAGGELGLVALIVPWHMYRQLKGTYGLTRGSALVRTAILSVFSVMSLAIFMAIIFALGAIG